MRRAKASKTEANLPVPSNGAHSNSSPQVHRLGMTPHLTGTLHPQRAQTICLIIYHSSEPSCR